MTNSIIRQLKIDMITDTPNPIIEWFNDLWAKLSTIETNVYHTDGGEIIYYTILDDKKQWIFFQDNKNDIFYCDYDHYWSFFEDQIDIKYNNAQLITKLMNELNYNVITASIIQCVHSPRVENALNYNLTTLTAINSK